MKQPTLLAFATAALLAAGPAFAGPNCSGCKDKGEAVIAEGTHRVAEREGKCNKGDDSEAVAAREGDKRTAERGEKRKAERGERGERSERERRSPMAGLEMSDEQKEAAKEIFDAAREEAQAIMAAAKESRENGDEVDREAIREQMREIRKGAMEKVYATVLTDEQKAKVDERRKKMEERRAEREKNGELREGKRKSKDGEGKERSRNRGDGLDI